MDYHGPRFIKSPEMIIRDVKNAFYHIGIYTACITAFCCALPYALDGIMVVVDLF